MSVEIIVEPVSSWKQLPAIPLPQRCGASSAPRPQPHPQPQPRCPPGCMPAENGQLPPGFRRVSRDSLSPRLNRIIDEQLKKIADGQQRQQRRQSKQQQQLIQQQRQQQQNHYQQYQHQQNGLARAHSEAALSQSAFHTRSPQPIIADAARASGYALSHATSISASVDQLPAAIKEVLSVADNIVPEPGKVTYISSSTCQPACNQQQEQHHQQYDPCGEPEQQQQQYDPCSEPVSPPPPPQPRPQPRPRPRPVPVRPSSPYEVLPIIHVDRCDQHNPCNQNRQVPADCAPQHSRLTGPAQSNNNNNNCGMTIEIEVSTGNCQ